MPAASKIILRSREIMKEIKSGGDEALDIFESALLDGSLSPFDISIAEMAAVEFGHERMRSIQGMESLESIVPAIKSSQLNKFLQVLIQGTLMRECPREQYHLQNLFQTINVPNCQEGDKIIGLFDAFEAKDLCEGEQYPFVGIDTDFEELPQAYKFGFLVALTRELLCRHGATINLFRIVEKIRRALDAAKEDKLYNAALGITPLYIRTGTTWDTYYEALGVNQTPFQDGGPWENAQANPFFCLQDLEESNELGDNMVDLKTGAPCPVEYNTVMTSHNTAKKMMVATRAFQVESDGKCEGNTCNQRVFSRPEDVLFSGLPNVIGSRQRWSRKIQEAYGVTKAQADEWWAHLDPSAFEWWSHWDEVTQEELPEARVNRDIATVYKASNRGMVVSNGPQLITMNTHRP